MALSYKLPIRCTSRCLPEGGLTLTGSDQPGVSALGDEDKLQAERQGESHD
jgi:hypothetical protein